MPSEPVIRELAEVDLFNGFLTSLDSLRHASGINRRKAVEIFRAVRSNPNHIILVAALEGKVVGSITMLIEPKFIHDGAFACHIEDVVVRREMQGRGIGARLVRGALEYAARAGCYKTILYCKDDVKGFYKGLGFRSDSNAMRFDH